MLDTVKGDTNRCMDIPVMSSIPEGWSKILSATTANEYSDPAAG